MNVSYKHFSGKQNWITSNFEHLSNHSHFSYFSSDLPICPSCNFMWWLQIILLIKYFHCNKFRMRMNIFTVLEIYLTSFDCIFVSRRYNRTWSEISCTVKMFILIPLIKLSHMTKHLKLLFPETTLEWHSKGALCKRYHTRNGVSMSQLFRCDCIQCLWNWVCCSFKITLFFS